MRTGGGNGTVDTLTAGQLSLLIAKLIEERVRASFQGMYPVGGRVLEHLRHKVERLLRCPRPEHFTPWMRLDLRKFKLGIVRVHRANLLALGCPEHLNDLDQLQTQQ